MSLLGELERKQVSDLGVLRFITCGSVDDGKSTLIGRLLHDSRTILQDQLDAVTRASAKRGTGGLDLSLLTDGLEAEREQGITIDVAYRYFSTGRRKFIIADTPGHEQYTRNMVTGASTAEAAVILLDATKGLQPQSRRHLLLAHLLGIRNVIVAVNKLDLTAYRQEVFNALCADLESFAAPLKIPNLRFVPMSALRGDMVVDRGGHLGWYQGPTLLEALEAVEAGVSDRSLPFRFPVQYVSRSDGARRYLGRVAAGVVQAGAEVVVLPSGRRTRVSGISVLEDALGAAVAGDSIALQLEDELDVSRGDMLAAAGAPPFAVKTFEANICWLSEEPLARKGRYLLRHTARTVKARIPAVHSRFNVHDLRREQVQGEVRMNDIVRATVVAQQPVYVDAYSVDRGMGAFILIDEASNQTVAGGMIE
jgi:sulfate adenylyltransferase subunit 1